MTEKSSLRKFFTKIAKNNRELLFFGFKDRFAHIIPIPKKFSKIRTAEPRSSLTTTPLKKLLRVIKSPNKKESFTTSLLVRVGFDVREKTEPPQK